MSCPRVTRIAPPACPALAKCATNGAEDASSFRAPEPQHIARVEQDARHHAKTALWLNPPPLRAAAGAAP